MKPEESKMYDAIGSEEELKWFFDHAMFPLGLTESYLFVMCSRHKKLTKEEQEAHGLTRRSAEFLHTESLRRPKFKSNGTDADKAESLARNITFPMFLRTIARFNFDRRAYTTATDEPIPDGTLAILVYANPCDDVKVWDEVSKKMEDVKTGLARAALPVFLGNAPDPGVFGAYQAFGNVTDMIKHAKAHCKGTRYWLDYDIDLPAEHKEALYGPIHDLFAEKVGKGNFIMVDTSGGYHVLIRTFTIKWNPHHICRSVLDIIGDRADEKTECIVNDSQIPGLPLPGTLQYGRLVTVANKEDFE